MPAPAWVLPTAISIGSVAAYPLIERLLYGSREDQMREQLEIQDQFERERMGGSMPGADMGDLGGLVGGGRMSLSDLMAEEALTRKAAGAGRALERLSQARPRYMDELEQIIGGQSARIAALQSERTMTPLEIISMVEGGFG